MAAEDWLPECFEVDLHNTFSSDFSTDPTMKERLHEEQLSNEVDRSYKMTKSKLHENELELRNRRW